MDVIRVLVAWTTFVGTACVKWAKSLPRAASSFTRTIGMPPATPHVAVTRPPVPVHFPTYTAAYGPASSATTPANASFDDYLFGTLDTFGTFDSFDTHFIKAESVPSLELTTSFDTTLATAAAILMLCALFTVIYRYRHSLRNGARLASNVGPHGALAASDGSEIIQIPIPYPHLAMIYASTPYLLDSGHLTRTQADYADMNALRHYLEYPLDSHPLELSLLEAFKEAFGKQRGSHAAEKRSLEDTAEKLQEDLADLQELYRVARDINTRRSQPLDYMRPLNISQRRTDWKATKSESTKTCQDLENEVRMLKNGKARLEGEVSEHQAEIDRLQEDNRREISVLRQKTKKEARDGKEAYDQLQAEKERGEADHRAQRVKLEQNLKDEEKTISDLRHQLMQANTNAESLRADLSAEKRRADEESRRLKNDGDDSTASYEKRFEAQKTENDDLVSRLRRELEKSNAAVDKSRSQASNLKVQLDESAKQLQSWEGEAQGAISQASQEGFKQGHQTAVSEIQRRASVDLTECQERAMWLQLDNDDLSAQIAELLSQMADAQADCPGAINQCPDCYGPMFGFTCTKPACKESAVAAFKAFLDETVGESTSFYPPADSLPPALTRPADDFDTGDNMHGGYGSLPDAGHEGMPPSQKRDEGDMEMQDLSLNPQCEDPPSMYDAPAANLDSNMEETERADYSISSLTDDAGPPADSQSPPEAPSALGSNQAATTSSTTTELTSAPLRFDLSHLDNDLFAPSAQTADSSGRGFAPVTGTPSFGNPFGQQPTSFGGVEQHISGSASMFGFGSLPERLEFMSLPPPKPKTEPTTESDELDSDDNPIADLDDMYDQHVAEAAPQPQDASGEANISSNTTDVQMDGNQDHAPLHADQRETEEDPGTIPSSTNEFGPQAEAPPSPTAPPAPGSNQTQASPTATSPASPSQTDAPAVKCGCGLDIVGEAKPGDLCEQCEPHYEG